MFRIAMIAIIALALGPISGCGNLSPRDNLSPILDQRLDDIEGNQSTLENNQNAIKIELGRLQNALEIQGRNNEVQQGWFNVQADGIIIAVFALLTISMLLYYMHRSAKNKKVADILADQIRAHEDWELKENIMAAAWNTSVEKTIFKMID
jgi:hypothetical protein